MSRMTKAALLGASDLREEEITLETLGNQKVLVRGLGAGFSNQAQSEALVMKTTPRGDQIASVNTAKMEAIQLLHGLADPALDDISEAEKFMGQNGPAARQIVDKIDELSGVNKEELEKAQAQFPASEEAKDGSQGPASVPTGGDGPDKSVRARAEDGQVGS